MDKQGKTLIAILVVIVLAIVGYQLMAKNNAEQQPGEQMNAASETPAATEQAAQQPAEQPATEQAQQATEQAGANLQQAGAEISEEAQKMGNRVEDAVTTSPAEQRANEAEAAREQAE